MFNEFENSATQLNLFGGAGAKKTKVKKNSTAAAKSRLPWTKRPFLCLDTETTGLKASENRVIEIAWVRYENFQELSSTSQLCRINKPLPSVITKITGIDDAMLNNALPFSAHVNDLIEDMNRVDFYVAYNAPFDRGFLSEEFKRIGRVMPAKPWVDPCVFIREFDKFEKSKKLGDAAARWGVNLNGAHRALADTRATGELLYKLATKINTNDLDSLYKRQETLRAEQQARYDAYKRRRAR